MTFSLGEVVVIVTLSVGAALANNMYVTFVLAVAVWIALEIIRQ